MSTHSFPLQSNAALCQQISLDAFAYMLTRFPFTRAISSIHVHGSQRPNHRQYRGRETLLDMLRQHVDGYGFATLAQHLTVAPDGTLWLGRNWNSPPDSAKGHSGNSSDGPFMIMLIGDFDYGGDRFDGIQRAVATDVIARLQHAFDLPRESLRFQRQLSSTATTSPGASIDYDTLLKELRSALATVRKVAKDGKLYKISKSQMQQSNLLINAFAQENHQGAEAMDRNDIRAGAWTIANAPTELGAFATPERDFSRYANGGNPTTQSRFLGPNVNEEMVDELRPYTINLTLGRFSNDGIMETSKEDVDTIFEECLPRALEDSRARREKLRLLFYAHGGLVGEGTALTQALQHYKWWRANNVYPIFFIWETGFWPMFLESLKRSRGRGMARETFTDRIVDTLARAFRGPQLWQAIKSSAYIASIDPEGGARYVIDKLAALANSAGDDLELHGIGHSAGAIFHSHFVPEIIKRDIGTFRTLSFLAPAVTIDDFREHLAGRMGKGIDSLPIFTMRRDLERNDPTASPVYNRSILYMVHNAMERERNTPVLGLEESLRADREMKRLFGLDGRPSEVGGEVIWATTGSSSGRSASKSKRHIDFNADISTMNAALRRILDVDDNDPITSFPPEYAAGTSRGGGLAVEFPPELAQLAEEGLINSEIVGDIGHSGGSSSMTTGGLGSGVGVPPAPLPGSGRRRALCIGIDDYEQAPLAGCVNDTKMWEAALVRLGFEQPTVLLNGEATRQAMINAIESLIRGSRSGDVLVIQFAGHGIQLPDIDGDEINESSSDDEALCPVDYTSGAYLIDDDIRELFEHIPDGVNLTCFFDCCHSGSSTRLGIGPKGIKRSGKDERPRFLRPTSERVAAHHRFRQDMGFQRSIGSRGPVEMRQVAFSACKDTEVAWESEGHGEFTLHAIAVLESSVDGITNGEFHRQVLGRFGRLPRQNPEIDCAPHARDYYLLQPLVQMS